MPLIANIWYSIVIVMIQTEVETTHFKYPDIILKLTIHITPPTVFSAMTMVNGPG